MARIFISAFSFVSFSGRALRRAPVALLLVLLLGNVVHATPSGSFINTFVSTVDNSQQFYGIYIPISYNFYNKHPVIFIGHGFKDVATNSFSSYQQSFANTNGWLLVQLQGRGNCFYNGVGENDFFEVLADMNARGYTLDQNRFYFEGASMGATGAFSFGVRFPDVFAAVGGCDGFADYRQWYDQYYSPAGSPTEVAPCRVPNLLMDSFADTAARAKWQHTWITVDQADTSVWPANGNNFYNALVFLGAATPGNTYANVYVSIPWGGHCYGYNEPAMYNYFLTVTNNRYPSSLVITTNRLKYGAEYWARINRLQTVNVFGTLNATVTGNAVTVTTSNLLGLTLTLDANVVNTARPVIITVDGLSAYNGPAGTITLYAQRNSSGVVTGWGTIDPDAARTWKRAGLEGPIGDAYTSPFTVVYGTAGTAAQVQANLTEANNFCNKWNIWMGANIAPIPETSLTAAQIANDNVMLYGTVESSTLLQGMQTQLPLQVHAGSVSVGGTIYTGSNYGAYFVYPNPLNPAHYLVVSHGSIIVPQATIHAWVSDPPACAKDLEALPWYWPDYVVFRTDITPRTTVQPKLAYLPDAFVAADYFDVNWQLPLVHQPDVMICTGTGDPYTGDNVYTGAQSVTQTVDTGVAAIYTVAIQNDGSATDTFTVNATASGNGMTVTYADAVSGANLTTALTNGTTVTLATCASWLIRLTITLDATVPTGATRTVTVTATAAGISNAAAAVSTIRTPPLTAVTLVPSPTSPQVYGATITLTATATGGANIVYQFLANTAILQDYSPANTCTWTPANAGTYSLTVNAEDLNGANPTAVVTSPAVSYVVTQPATWPTVTAQSVSSMTANGAQLNATVTDTGGATISAAGFNYGATNAYGSSVAAATVPTSGGGFSASLSDLSSNTIYHYQGYATNYMGTGYTDDATFTTPAGVPTNLSTSNPTASSIDITWSLASDDGGAETLTYYVQVATDDGFTNVVWSDSLTNTNDTATGLASNTNYYLEVYATNSEGMGDADYTMFTTAAGVPTIVSTSSPTTSICDISWLPASDNGGTETLTYYVLVATDDGFTNVVWWDTLTNMSDTAVGLDSNTTYYIEVYAANSEGTGPADDVTFTTAAGDATNLYTSNPMASTCDIAWSPPSDDGGAETLTYYVQVATDDGFTSVVWSDTLESTSDTATRLDSNTTYYIAVNADNGEGTGSEDYGMFTTAAGVPTNVSTSNPTPSSVDITWSPASDDGGAETLTYTVQVATDSGFTNVVWSDSLTSTSDTATGLDPNTTYYIEVNAANGEGNTSDWSAYVTAGPLSAVALIPAPFPASPSVAGTGITLTATAAGGANVVYQFLVNGVSLGDYSASNTCIWTPTTAGTYSLTVNAEDLNGADPTAFVTSPAVSYVVTPQLTISPSIVTVILGQTQQFTTNLDGATWSAATGTIDQNGLYTATAGGPDTVTVNVGAQTASATVYVQEVTRVSLVGTTIARGAQGTVMVQMQAHGEESAIGFSVQFDPTQLQYVSSALGTDASDAMLLVNTTGASSGHLGYIVGLYIGEGQSFPVGTLDILQITFTAIQPGNGSATAPLTFTDAPCYCEVDDAYTNVLPDEWTNGTVTIPPLPSATFTATPLNIIAGQSSMLAWTTSNVNSTSIDNGVGIVIPVASGNVTVSPMTTTTYTLTATGMGGTITQTVTVTMTPSVILTITPATASLCVGQTQQFTANSTGVTWSSALGAINATGLYTAPSETAIVTDTVTATMGAQTATAIVTIQGGYEGDVASRPNGDGRVTLVDWVQEGRFVVGLDVVQDPGSEVQRADCAPRATGGDGRLTLADWVQTGRYSAGLDPLTPVDGPWVDPVFVTDGVRRGAATTVRLVNTTMVRNTTGTVTVQMDAQGDENAVGFSVKFDPTQLQYVSSVIGADAANATLIKNTTKASSGLLSLLLGLDVGSGATFAKGTRNVLTITFKAIDPDSEPTVAALTFVDSPAYREVVGVNASVLETTWTNGAVSIPR